MNKTTKPKNKLLVSFENEEAVPEEPQRRSPRANTAASQRHLVKAGKDHLARTAARSSARPASSGRPRGGLANATVGKTFWESDQYPDISPLRNHLWLV